MTNQHELIKDITDSKPVRIFLPLKDTKERYRVQGVYQKTTPPDFNLLFRSGILPIEAIDSQESCIVTVDLGGSLLSLEALIKDIVSPQILQMRVQKSFSPEQMRDFFRVDAVTSVIGKSFQPALFSKKDQEWSLQGQTIDISGSGILASFHKPPPKENLLKLELQLPTESQETITLLARNIRTTKVSDEQYDVAFHFEDILSEDRDKIIGCCLQIQRQLLRLKVKVKDV